MPGKGHKVYPYLLKGLPIERPNQAWSTDITYIPMAKGFLYLVAIIDWYSRKVLAAQQEGAKAKNKKNKEPRDIDEDYKNAMHLTTKGKNGIPAPAFRSAMISACRVAGFQMTKAKLSIFIEPDDFDADDGTPLVYIVGKPAMHQSSVRLESGVASIAIRPMWREWGAKLRVKFDSDQFSTTDVANLLMRAGMQVGVGEGRPDSKKSHGMGWGTFKINED